MSKQIAVRLPDDLLTYLDARVEAGEGSSRAGIVIDLLWRERRRDRARQDAVILAQLGTDPELDRLAEYASTVDLGDLA